MDAVWGLARPVQRQHTTNRAMRACRGVSDATWRRAKGWAVFYGVTLGTSGLAGDTRHALMARRTLERVVAGP